MASFEFHSLRHCSLGTLALLFNQAFSDYIIKIQLNPQQLKQKMILDRIDLDYSVGASLNGQWVGFILSAVGLWEGQKTAYNAGTGVVPAYRGNRLTKQMYNWLIPKLKEANIHQGLLEVINTNEVAIHNYKKLGFSITRNLDCMIFKEEKPLKYPIGDQLISKELFDLDWEYIKTFWNFQPSWQNDIEGVKALTGSFAYLGVFKNDEWVAYAIKDPVKGRIAQFGVQPKHRNQSVGTYLFHSLHSLGNPKQSIINIDQSDEKTINFLESIGFEYYIGQYEMTCKF